jgi:hypothetical protein
LLSPKWVLESVVLHFFSCIISKELFLEGEIVKETTTPFYDEDYILSLIGKRSAPDYPDIEKTGSQLLSKMYIEDHNSTIKGIDHVRNYNLFC